MFYSVPPSKVTPTPFAELRVFFFMETEPTRSELIIAKRGMKVILERLMDVFFTLPYAIDKGRADYEEEMSMDGIRARIRTEIHGFEVEEVDVDEVSKWFKERHKVLRLLENYRYARFYNEDGTIKKEYDEWDIREAERRMEVEMYREVGRRITLLYGEIVEYMRKLEESRREYERLIEELRRMVIV
jgi:hypothetical protein